MDKPDKPTVTLVAKDGRPVTAEAPAPKPAARKPHGNKGRKPINKIDVTARQRRMISVALAAGMNLRQIAGLLGCSVRTLEKRFRKELDDGGAIINAKVASKLFSKCMKGDTIALIYWTKTRMGWNEKQRIEHTGADGGPIVYEQVEAEAAAFTDRIARMAERFIPPEPANDEESEPSPPAAKEG